MRTSSIKRILTAFALFCVCSISVPAQTPAYEEALRRQNAERLKRQQERDLIDRRRNLENLKRIGPPSAPAIFNRKTLSRKLRRERDKLVAPHADDLKLFEDFLNRPKTGIFRLFPDKNCLVNINVVRVDGECRNIFPHTWFYSFREKDYSDDALYDLLLRNGKLSTDGFLSQGILVSLGNFSLDNVTLESRGAKFIAAFNPEEKAADIKARYERIRQGIEVDGFRYSKEVEAQVGEVYLLRVVAYRVRSKFFDRVANNTARELNANFFLLDEDKREDITVAFRIINKGPDGNLTIIWKELARKKSPEIIFSDG